MCSSRVTLPIILAVGMLATAPDLRAQSFQPQSSLSLFGDYEAAAPGARVFSGAFGRYGVAFATSDAAPRLHGPGPETRIDPHLAGVGQESGSLALIGAYTVNQFRVAVDIRRDKLDFERRRSSTEFGLGFMSPITSALTVGGGPTIGFGDVTPSRGPLRPSGEHTVGLNGAATLSLSENWALTGVLGYRARAAGAKEESFFSVLGLGYRF